MESVETDHKDLLILNSFLQANICGKLASITQTVSCGYSFQVCPSNHYETSG